MPPDSFTQPELSSSETEETPAPHLPAEEVWTAVPYGPPPSRALTAEEKWPSEWHSVCWMAAHGASQRTIAKELGYSERQISAIMNQPTVQEKIEQIRREFLGTESLNKRYAAIAPKAADFMANVIQGKEAAKTGERLDASKWMLEQVSGKAKQSGTQESGTTILQLLQALEAVKEAKALQSRSVGEPDIELRAEAPKDPLADWVAANVPGGVSEEGK